MFRIWFPVPCGRNIGTERNDDGETVGRAVVPLKRALSRDPGAGIARAEFGVTPRSGPPGPPRCARGRRRASAGRCRPAARRAPTAPATPPASCRPSPAARRPWPARSGPARSSAVSSLIAASRLTASPAARPRPAVPGAGRRSRPRRPRAPRGRRRAARSRSRARRVAAGDSARSRARVCRRSSSAAASRWLEAAGGPVAQPGHLGGPLVDQRRRAGPATAGTASASSRCVSRSSRVEHRAVEAAPGLLDELPAPRPRSGTIRLAASVGGGGAHVGHVVDQRRVGLVADRADHRGAAARRPPGTAPRRRRAAGPRRCRRRGR